MSGNHARNARIDGIGGSFANVRLTGDHITLAVEGRDQDGLSVAGMSLTIEGTDLLIERLVNVRAELARKILDSTPIPPQADPMQSH